MNPMVESVKDHLKQTKAWKGSILIGHCIFRPSIFRGYVSFRGGKSTNWGWCFFTSWLSCKIDYNWKTKVIHNWRNKIESLGSIHLSFSGIKTQGFFQGSLTEGTGPVMRSISWPRSSGIYLLRRFAGCRLQKLIVESSQTKESRSKWMHTEKNATFRLSW